MRLGVNVDHVATLRQARKAVYPSPLEAAKKCQEAGADNITFHLREDRRHIQDHDIFDVQEHIELPLNLEIAATEEMVLIAKRLRPRTVTLVPERREEVTTEGGLKLAGQREKLRGVIGRLLDSGIEEVSLFVDADLSSVEHALNLTANGIEIHTGNYAEAETKANPVQVEDELAKIVKLAAQARQEGLSVHAGHGLNYRNVGRIAGIAGLESLQIGHAIVAEAVFVGLFEAVTRMKRLIENPSR